MEPLPLHALHASLAARFGALGGREVVLGYGESTGETSRTAYRAARSEAAIFDRSARQLLALTGEDRVSFLHGMVTNDINGLTENAACDAAFLTAKGAMVADARVVKLADRLLLDVEPGLLEKVREFLDKYLISEDVELGDVTGDFGQLTVLGARAGEVVAHALGLASLPEAENALMIHPFSGATLYAIGNRRLSGAGVDLIVPRVVLEQTFTALQRGGATPVGFETLEGVRIEAGVPRYGADMVDTTIPLEANLTHAISYNKGCYIGQEVIARATFRGHMNRKLVGLLLESAEVAAGAELRVEDKKVGWVTSVSHSPSLERPIALGYVHRAHLDQGTVLTVTDPSQPARATSVATVQTLPFVAP